MVEHVFLEVINIDYEFSFFGGCCNIWFSFVFCGYTTLAGRIERTTASELEYTKMR